MNPRALYQARPSEFSVQTCAYSEVGAGVEDGGNWTTVRITVSRRAAASPWDRYGERRARDCMYTELESGCCSTLQTIPPTTCCSLRIV